MAVTIAKGKALDTINLTPVIDIVFNLLIFFMVVSEFAKEDRSLEMRLPTASEAKPISIALQPIFIAITKEGQLMVEGRQVSLTSLENSLDRAMANNPATQSIVIRADKDVALQHAVSVVNLLHRLGITNYDFNTAGPEE